MYKHRCVYACCVYEAVLLDNHLGIFSVIIKMVKIIIKTSISGDTNIV